MKLSPSYTFGCGRFLFYVHSDSLIFTNLINIFSSSLLFLFSRLSEYLFVFSLYGGFLVCLRSFHQIYNSFSSFALHAWVLFLFTSSSPVSSFLRFISQSRYFKPNSLPCRFLYRFKLCHQGTNLCSYERMSCIQASSHST